MPQLLYRPLPWMLVALGVAVPSIPSRAADPLPGRMPGVQLPPRMQQPSGPVTVGTWAEYSIHDTQMHRRLRLHMALVKRQGRIYWGEMTFRIGLHITEANPDQPCTLELRIHRYATLASQTIETVDEVNLTVKETGWVEREMVIPIDDNYCYAILGKVIKGDCRFGKIEINALNAHHESRRGIIPALLENEMTSS